MYNDRQTFQSQSLCVKSANQLVSPHIRTPNQMYLPEIIQSSREPHPTQMIIWYLNVSF